MIKVRVLHGFAAAGAAALALPSALGCSAPSEEVGSGTENFTEISPGSGSLALHSYRVDYASTSGGDEFVRVGEKMTFAVAFNDVLHRIASEYDPTLATLRTELLADPSKVKLTLKVTYTKADESKSAAPDLAFGAWAAANGGFVGTSPAFVIPNGTKLMAVEVVAAYDKAGIPSTTEVVKARGIANEFVVFGAFAPNKLALFDTVGGDRRTRVVEGGAILKGSHAVLSYTDWRLDTVSDKGSMDLRIGQKNSGSRFGNVVVDALGSLEYEVSAAISTDGGATYNPVSLKKVERPAVLSRSEGLRYALETEIPIAADAGPSLKVAFHVQAFLQVPNFSNGEIQNARYAPNQRVLLRDTWDNNDGHDYALPIQ